MTKMKYVSMYAGAGGFEIGFDGIHENLVSVEIERDAVDTLVSNGFENAIQADCAEFDLSRHKGADLFIGGPPCQGFSAGGKQQLGDKRSEHVVTFTLKATDVGARLLMENVPPVLSDKFAGYRDTVLKILETRGYYHSWEVYDMSEYGVPQKRKRAILFASKDRQEVETFDSYMSTSKVQKIVTFREVVDGFDFLSCDHSLPPMSAKVVLAKKPIIRASIYTSTPFNGSGRVINPDGLSQTIVATASASRAPVIEIDEKGELSTKWSESYYDLISSPDFSPHTERVIAPPCMIRMPYEVMKMVQTFPDNYKVSGSRSSQIKQLGNAVPPKFSRILAEAIAVI